MDVTLGREQYDQLLVGDETFVVTDGGQYAIHLSSSDLDDLSSGSLVTTCRDSGEELTLHLPRQNERSWTERFIPLL